MFENDSDYSQYVGERGADYVEPHVVAIKNSVNVYYKELPMPEKISKYLTIEALEDDLTVSFSTNTIQYSIDSCQTWNELPRHTETPAINSGDKISFKSTVTSISKRGIGKFTVNKKFNLKGNVMSMLFGDEGDNSFDLTGCDYVFYQLFYECTTLQSVSKDFLPTTTLANYCYSNMFYGCTSLINAPELPATTLAENCYRSMFYGCTSLVTAPDLPATTLASDCYHDMFNGTNVLPDCTNIDFTSESVVASGGLSGLFRGTKITDENLYNILPINPSTNKYWLPATTLADGCYSYMFQGCSSLVTAPELPATTLTDSCYNSMFSGCSSLVTAPELPATTLADSCYKWMFQNCSSLTTAPELPATTLVDNCYEFMFKGCTSLINAPELPTTTLTDSCYNSMFSGCSKLNYIKMLAIDISAKQCLTSWVTGVSSTGTFVKNAAATWNVTGANGIPTGWTVETV